MVSKSSWKGIETTSSIGAISRVSFLKTPLGLIPVKFGRTSSQGSAMSWRWIQTVPRA